MEQDKLKELQEELLTREEVMSIFKVTTQTVWKWVRGGYIREHSFGRSRFYLWSEILEDLKTNGSSLRKNHRIKAKKKEEKK